MRVFISSTCHDLIDARAEVAALLTEMGIDPVLSDDKLSDFRVVPNQHSIETCLVNVRSCDEVIVLINQRYGPTLERFDYEGISATHLEYRTAKEARKPIHFFVRDRTEADFAVWRKNKSKLTSIDLPWVTSKNEQIFAFIDEHTSHKPDSSTSNWYTTFSSSVDLKKVLRRRLSRKIKPELLRRAIDSNNFPSLDVKLELVKSQMRLNEAVQHFRFYVKNIANAAAFDVKILNFDVDGEVRDFVDVLPCNDDKFFYFVHQGTGNDFTREFDITYKSALGIEVRERYRFGVTTNIIGNARFAGGGRIDRAFSLCDEPTIQVTTSTGTITENDGSIGAEP